MEAHRVLGWRGGDRPKAMPGAVTVGGDQARAMPGPSPGVAAGGVAGAALASRAQTRRPAPYFDAQARVMCAAPIRAAPVRAAIISRDVRSREAYTRNARSRIVVRATGSRSTMRGPYADPRSTSAAKAGQWRGCGMRVAPRKREQAASDRPVALAIVASEKASSSGVTSRRNQARSRRSGCP
ncbi:MAG: hypothetical protein ACYDB1_10295 [Acidiferrobacteraceae bacterium]